MRRLCSRRASHRSYRVRAGVDPLHALEVLGDRLITLQLHDLHERSPKGHDVPWGTGAIPLEAFLREAHRRGLRPTLFGLEYSRDWLDSMPELAECVAFFDRLSLELAR